MIIENKKNVTAYKTIGEVAKEIGLVDERTGILQTHTLRYWESQFKQIKPSIRAGKRRYYSPKDLEIIIYIKHLLKEKGLTINGVKKILNNEASLKLDEIADKSIRIGNLKNKLIKISNKLKELKDGKKNTR